MVKKYSRTSIILASALVLSFAVSLSLYFIVDNVHITRTFFFPDRRGGMAGETRRLPDKHSDEDRIGQFVEELILGPFDIDHNRLIPEDTRLLSVMLREKDTVFLDFSADYVIDAGSTGLNYQEISSGVIMNIRYNFPFVKHVVIAVDGEQLKLGE